LVIGPASAAHDEQLVKVDSSRRDVLARTGTPPVPENPNPQQQGYR
jgi:hypothetical protein